MKRIWSARRLALASALSLAGLIAAVASCATDSNDTPPGPEPAPLPEASTDVSTPTDLDAGPQDAGCDAGDPSCTTEVASCDDVAWCMAATPGQLVHPLMAIWGSSKSDVWAVGSGGTILHYDGAAWKETPSGLKYTFYGVWGSGPKDVWVAATTGVILRAPGFENGTATWTPAPAEGGSGRQVRAIWGSSPADIRIGTAWFSTFVFEPTFEVLSSGTFAGSVDADGGTTWRPLFTPGSPAGASITSIWGSSATDIWMTGDNSQLNPYERGKTMHGTLSDAGESSDAGGTGPSYDRLTWTSVDSQSNVTLDSIWGSSASDVWAVGAVGTIRHITPNDVRWQKVDSPTIESLHGVWGSGPNDIWAVGDSGTIIHWDGKSFTSSTAQLPIGKKPNLYAVWGSGPDDVWIVGEKVLLHYTGSKSESKGRHK